MGKRIFISIRQEVDDGAPLYEQVKAVVPKPEWQEAQKGLSPSKHHAYTMLATGHARALG